MNLDDAIKHCEDVAEENYGKAIEYLNDREVYKHEEQKCVKCADEHMQLAEWLRDYKRLLEQEPTVTSTEDNAEMIYPQVEGITPTLSVSENPNNCDLISREEVLENAFKTGHWVTELDTFPTNPRCSECGGEPYYSNTIYNYKFCPYCGARMEVEQHG